MKTEPLQLLTLDQVAAELQVCDRTLRRYVREKFLPVIRISRKTVRVDRKALDKYLQGKQS